jgi:hypothetical protein
MDSAIQNAARYATRHPDSPTNKLTGCLKSAIGRRAKQLAAARSRESSFGSLRALEKVYSSQPEAEQRTYANELLARLSPFGQSIANWRFVGYSWREIAGQLEMDHTVVRRAYFRELEALLRSLSQPGDRSGCD